MYLRCVNVGEFISYDDTYTLFTLRRVTNTLKVYPPIKLDPRFRIFATSDFSRWTQIEASNI